MPLLPLNKHTPSEIRHCVDAPPEEQRGTASAGTKPTILEQQSFYEFDHKTGVWVAKALSAPNAIPTNIIETRISVLSWNVDFMEEYKRARLRGLISHIQNTMKDVDATIVSTTSTFPIILLQEIHSSCFPALLLHPMVRKSYAVTSISPEAWSQPSARYGVVTLIPHGLTPILDKVFRVPFTSSMMGREALFVDFRVQPDKVIRVANTHLESLRGSSDDARVKQLTTITDFLHAPNVYGGLVGGDMNPIGPLDAGLATRLGLVDAWIATRQVDASATYVEEEEGYTWGYQPLNRWSPKRMDKFLLCGKLEVVETTRIGMGQKVKVIASDTDDTPTNFVWLSDHYGLVTKINIV